MALWRPLVRGLRALARRREAEQERADEVEHYLEQAAAEHRRRGLAPEAALRAARAEVGSATTVRQEVRQSGWESRVEELLADLRYAARRLRAEPGLTAVIVLTLALGLGGATAIFSTLKPVLLEPLPYPEPERVVMVWEQSADGERVEGSFGMYRELAARARSIRSVAVLRSWQPTITGSAEPERLEGQRVSAGYFGVLGVRPALGRLFGPADDRLGGPAVVVLSDRLWRRRFGADPGIVGRSIPLDDLPHLVAGVMPADFENLLAPAAELWAPLQYDMSQGRAWGHHLRTIARLEPGGGPAEARAELREVGRAGLRELRPPTYGAEIDFAVVPLRADLTRGVRPALLAVAAAVALLLGIACVNVANLLLSRDARRRRELAVRLALGAGRGRLVRQLLTESLLLALLGGVAGVAVAAVGVRALAALAPPELPRAGAIAVDGGVLLFALGLTTLVGVAFGMAPALRAASRDPHPTLQLESARGAGGRRGGSSPLVVVEVALALVLLVTSGLLVRSLARLLAVEPGFDPARVLTLQVQTAGARLAADSSTWRFFERSLRAVREVPGVDAAALSSQLPLSGEVDLYGVHFDPAPPDDRGEPRGTFRYAVSPGYFEALRIPLRRGRLLDARDGPGTPLAAVISESLAGRRLAGLDPIGQRLRIGTGPFYTVVGVVGDVRQESLALTDAEAVYVTAEQWRFADRAMWLVVRGTGNPLALAGAVREAVWSVDRDQPVSRVATLASLVRDSTAERRFTLAIFQAFAIAALVLSAAGIHAILAGRVAERRREIGIRAALGASGGQVAMLVLRQAMALAGIGVGIGLLGALLASRAIRSMFFGISPLDPLAYAGGILALGLVALAAAAAPAWRSVRVDPVEVLKAD